jgi:uncharacterized membrane protein
MLNQGIASPPASPADRLTLTSKSRTTRVAERRAGIIRSLKWTAIAGLLLAYPLLAHYAALTAAGDLGALLAVLPLAAIALGLSWRSPRRLALLALAGFVFALVLLADAWELLKQHFGWLFLVQYVATHLALCLVFGHTLLGGRRPLCSRFAEAIEQRSLPASVNRYTRRLTAVWTAYFAVMAVASSVLFWLAPFTAWSVFANFLTPLCLLLMFLAEYAIRLRVLPHVKHASLLDSIRVFWQSPPSLGRPD